MADGTEAPSGIPAQEAPASPSPMGTEVGVPTERVVAEPAPAPEAEEAGDTPPEGYDTWEAYGKAVAKGEVKPAEAKKEEEAAPAQEDPELKAQLEALPEAVREKAAPLFKEFTDTGTLTAESKKAAAETFGVTEEMVDIYLAGAQSTQEAALTPFYEAAGGKEAYAEFTAWAATGLTAEEQAEFNAELDKGPEEAKAMITKATALWRQQGGGKPPRDITRDVPLKDAETLDVYASRAEMQRDMNDPKYAKDPAFRAKVEAKVGRSNI